MSTMLPSTSGRCAGQSPLEGSRLLVRPHVLCASRVRALKIARQRVILTRAADEGGDDGFEARLAALKKAKGQTPYGESRVKDPSAVKPVDVAPTVDYTKEELFFESGPHLGDAAINTVAAATLIWIPLTVAALTRAAFVKYRFTNMRMSVITSAPWKNEQLDAPYQDVKEVRSVGRGLGYWGDMVVVLKNGDKVELRAVPKHKELEKYILQQRDELIEKRNASAPKQKSQGFA